MMGDANTKPPKSAILTRSVSPSSGDVTNRLQVPLEDTMNEFPALVWCAVDASTLHSGRSKKCRIGS